MMNDDLQKYPVYMVYNNELQKADFIKDTGCYNHYAYQIHHFIRKSVRKNSPEFYARIEHLQKLILVPKEMNYDLETMGEDKFFSKWKIKKNDLVFNRKEWRNGYYEQK